MPTLEIIIFNLFALPTSVPIAALMLEEEAFDNKRLLIPLAKEFPIVISIAFD